MLSGTLFYFISNYEFRGIAQSGSAPALGAGCREFESLYPDQIIFISQPHAGFFFMYMDVLYADNAGAIASI